MKKYLALTVAMATLATVSQADFANGAYVGVTTGVSSTSAQLAMNTNAFVGAPTAAQIQAVNTAAGFQKKTGTGFVGGLNFGFARMINSACLFDVFAGVNYDTTKVKLVEVTTAQAAAMIAPVAAAGGLSAALAANPMTAGQVLTMKPQFGLTLGARFGRMLSNCVAGLVGLSVDYNFGKIEFTGLPAGTTAAQMQTSTGVKSNLRTLGLTPHVALRGAINDKLHWTAMAGYKFNVSTNLPKTAVVSFAKKPNAFVANVGLVYNI